MECVLLLFAAVCLLFCVSGNTDIQFAGFVPNTVYTYYTNGVNTHTQLTCNATSDSYTDISATWIDVIENVDTGSSVLSFEEIAAEVVWGYQRNYLCRAVYQTDPEMYQDSDSITVRIKYNTTITVSYGDTTHIRDIENTDYVYIHVMTEDVVISCDADMALWYYRPPGLSYQSNIPNPITIDLFTTQDATGYACTDVNIDSNRDIVKSVTLRAYGSGVYKRKQNTYTRLTEGKSVNITKDTTLVCVTSTTASITWYYRNTSTGVDDIVSEGVGGISVKAFRTLTLLTTSRAGSYYCRTKEITEDTYAFVDIKHNIIVSVPIVTTTIQTPTPTTPPTTTPPTTTTPTTTTTTTPPPTITTTTPTTPTTITTPTTTTTPLTITLTTEPTTTATTPKLTRPIATKAITIAEIILQQTTRVRTTLKQTTTTTTNKPTEVTTNTQISVVVYAVTGLLLLFVILLVSALVACSLILVRIVLKSKKTNKYKYKQSLEDTTPPANTTSDKKEYISLSEVPVRTKTQQTHKYEPMASLYPQKEYVPLEVTTPPNYYEMSESHFESDKDAKYENLTDVISS